MIATLSPSFSYIHPLLKGVFEVAKPLIVAHIAQSLGGIIGFAFSQETTLNDSPQGPPPCSDIHAQCSESQLMTTSVSNELLPNPHMLPNSIGYEAIKEIHGHTFTTFGNVNTPQQADLVFILDNHDDYFSQMSGGVILLTWLTQSFKKNYVPEEDILLRMEGVPDDFVLPGFDDYLTLIKASPTEYATHDLTIQIKGMEDSILTAKVTESSAKIAMLLKKEKDPEKTLEIQEKHNQIVTLERNQHLVKLIKADLQAGKKVIMTIGCLHLHFPGLHLLSLLNNTRHFIFDKPHNSIAKSIKDFHEATNAQTRANQLFSKGKKKEASELYDLSVEKWPSFYSKIEQAKHIPSLPKRLQEITLLRKESNDYFELEQAYIYSLIDMKEEYTTYFEHLLNQLNDSSTKESKKKDLLEAAQTYRKENETFIVTKTEMLSLGTRILRRSTNEAEEKLKKYKLYMSTYFDHRTQRLNDVLKKIDTISKLLEK